jgi:IS30 family transposase
MAKTGPLGKAESFYVEEKFKIGISIEEIAKDLDRAVGAIEKHIKKNKIEKPKTIMEQQFARQGGATIMTENASSMIDKAKKPSVNNSHCITKIK